MSLAPNAIDVGQVISSVEFALHTSVSPFTADLQRTSPIFKIRFLKTESAIYENKIYLLVLRSTSFMFLETCFAIESSVIYIGI